MVQLRSCYFCGGVGDSLREYEVIPEPLDSSAGGRSAVLCSTCHEKLRRVLEPLTGAAESSATPDPGPTSLQEVTFGSRPDAPDGTAAAGDEQSSETAPTGTAASTTSDGSIPDDGEPEGDAAADEPPESETTAAATDRSDDAGGTTGESDVPDEYYKVLRLLQNREFPMDRADLTGLVTGAYDVSEPQCERILETAIDRGVLVEKGSTLDLGRN
jgi:hypothetical protein